jgi:glycosyltransferase involved in cell wall biosynthesis
MFTTDYLPRVGGVAAHVHGLTRALSDAGHQVLVVTNVPGRNGDDLSGRRPRVLRVSERVRLMPFGRGRRVQFLLNLARPMLNELRGWDLVHFHTVDPLSTMLSAVWGTRPQVATNHTSMFVADSGHPQRAARWRRFFSRMDGVIAPSNELARLTIDIGVPGERVRYVPNGVDPARFHPEASGEPCRRRYGIPSGDLLILCPRRLVQKNGCIFLARAMRTILQMAPGARLLFAGDGPEREAIRQELESSGCSDRAVFAGDVSNDRMPGFYAAADVVVVPSLIEATSLSVLEAMASGRPVVGTRVGGLPALIEHGHTGYLTRPADEADLALRICRTLTDPDGRSRMGQAARRRVLAAFTWDRVAELTACAYETCLAGRIGNLTRSSAVEGKTHG